MKELTSHLCRLCQVPSSGLGSHLWSSPGTVLCLPRGPLLSTFSHHITPMLCWNVYLSTVPTLFHMINPCRQQKTCFVAVPFSADLEGTEAVPLANLAHCISHPPLAGLGRVICLWCCLCFQSMKTGATRGF